MANTQNIGELLHQAGEQLASISDSPFLDAELLLAHCIGKNRTYLHTWPEKQLGEKHVLSFKQFIKKRLRDYPVAYLLGKKAFWTLDLIVTEDVLIPRPETELLVEIALDKIKHIPQPKILDLGTGSGAIALALASERLDAMITATDVCENALSIAKKNQENLKLNQTVRFQQSNWFENLDENTAYFDLIVSNPPYIDPIDKHLKGSIRYEPQHALIAQNNGLSDLQTIIHQSSFYLQKGGSLILEHGYDQGAFAKKTLKEHHYQSIHTAQDLNHLDRITYGSKVL